MSDVTIALPPCYACIHFNQDDGRVCEAFPDGIPATILVGGASHNDPIGDEVDGITFDLDPERIEYHEIREEFVERAGL